MKFKITIATVTLLVFCLPGFSQTFNSFKKTQRLTYYPYTYISSETAHLDSTGIAVIIQNSVRKAGGSLDSTGEKGYTDVSGKKLTYAIFWTRIINKSSGTVDLTLSFPADWVALSRGNNYFKLFLPTDTMTIWKESLHNYGATGLKPFFDTHFDKPTRRQHDLSPGGDIQFYVAVLVSQGEGIDRVGLMLEGNRLYYKVDVAGQAEPQLIFCGEIVLRK